MKVLLTTIAIGEEYLEQYNQLFRKSHENYAIKHGYTFKVITDFIDKTRQNYGNISFNKILVGLDNTQYDIVIFIDSDILINPDSPPIHLLHVSGKISVVDEFSQPTKELRLAIQLKENYADKNASEYHRLCGYQLDTEMAFNTGVLMFNPNEANHFFRLIYDNCIPHAINHPRGFHWEQTSISFHIQNNNVHNVLPNKWNAIWALEKMSNPNASLELFYKENYFIHFAGKCDLHKVHLLR